MKMKMIRMMIPGEVEEEEEEQTIIASCCSLKV